ncbi:MAG: hypothetical protein LBS44_02985, partial [Deltaproteobacteria bacterium]|nr:hypothetical protein [Deltaproteobacteria bacterium]
MNKKLPELDFSSVRFQSLRDRPSKVNLSEFAKPLVGGGSFLSFTDGLSNILWITGSVPVICKFAKVP